MGTQHEIVPRHATRKVHELCLLFADLPVVPWPLDDVVTRELVVVETARPVDNAVKRRAVAEAMASRPGGRPLEVDALGGAPGVLGALRGRRATDAENNGAPRRPQALATARAEPGRRRAAAPARSSTR